MVTLVKGSFTAFLRYMVANCADIRRNSWVDATFVVFALIVKLAYGVVALMRASMPSVEMDISVCAIVCANAFKML